MKSKKTFTIIELLIVISIMAILMSILLPTIWNAREKTKRAVCMSNISQWTKVSFIISKTKNNRLPQMYRANGSGITVGRMINDDDYATEDHWKTYGNNWDEWQEYGINEAIATCPSFNSVNFQPHHHMSQPFKESVNKGRAWGKVTFSSYMYMAGLNSSTHSASTIKSDKIFAAQNMLKDDNPDEKLILADSVWWGGGSDWGWGDNYTINHMNPDQSVGFQARGMLDGHVSILYAGAYSKPLSYSSANALYSHGAFHFWEGTN